MDNLLLVGAALAMLVILTAGMSHLFMTEKDKADLATKSEAYRGFIQLCRIFVILVVIVVIVLSLGMCMDGGSGGGDYGYSRNGRYSS